MPAEDKALTAKELLTFHRVRTTCLRCHYRVGRPHTSNLARGGLRTHVIKEPLGMEELATRKNRRGIAGEGEAESLERAKFIHERFRTDALIEIYVPRGARAHRPACSKLRLTVFPPREIFFGSRGGPGAMTSSSSATTRPNGTGAFPQKKWGIRNGPAAKLPPL
jgi:hypothetical protein